MILKIPILTIFVTTTNDNRRMPTEDDKDKQQVHFEMFRRLYRNKTTGRLHLGKPEKREVMFLDSKQTDSHPDIPVVAIPESLRQLVEEDTARGRPFPPGKCEGIAVIPAIAITLLLLSVACQRADMEVTATPEPTECLPHFESCVTREDLARPILPCVPSWATYGWFIGYYPESSGSKDK